MGETYTPSMASRRYTHLIPALPALPTGARIVVACSGGLDSTVLLHALTMRGVDALIAVHVHHGLQAAADDWAQHCQALCNRLGVPMQLRHAAIADGDDAGPEGAARDARYALLRAAMQPGDVLATAHHRDDQAETVLLRLLRGTGVHGLAAMRPLIDFAPGRLWRPLLDQPRAAIRDYALQQGLTWIDDPHNQHLRYTRSWLRGHGLPPWRERFPGIDERLARTARLAAGAAELLDERAAEDHAAIAAGSELSVSGLLALSVARRHNLVRWWLQQRGFRPPFAEHLDRIDREILGAGPETEPLLQWPGCELRRYRDRLHAMAPLQPVPDGVWVEWTSGTRIELPGDCGVLEADLPPPRPVRVRGLRLSERIRPVGDAHSRECRKLFQQLGIPPWLRVRIPVLELDDDARCIAGIAMTAQWRESLAAQGWQGRWRHRFAGLASPVVW